MSFRDTGVPNPEEEKLVADIIASQRDERDRRMKEARDRMVAERRQAELDKTYALRDLVLSYLEMREHEEMVAPLRDYYANKHTAMSKAFGIEDFYQDLQRTHLAFPSTAVKSYLASLYMPFGVYLEGGPSQHEREFKNKYFSKLKAVQDLTKEVSLDLLEDLAHVAFPDAPAFVTGQELEDAGFDTRAGSKPDINEFW